MLRLLVRGVLDRLLIGAVLAYAVSLALGGSTCRPGGALAPFQDAERTLSTVIDGLR